MDTSRTIRQYLFCRSSAIQYSAVAFCLTGLFFPESIPRSAGYHTVKSPEEGGWGKTRNQGTRVRERGPGSEPRWERRDKACRN